MDGLVDGGLMMGLNDVRGGQGDPRGGTSSRGAQPDLVATDWCPFSIKFVEAGSAEHVHRTCRTRSQEPQVVYLSKSNRLEVKLEGTYSDSVPDKDGEPPTAENWKPYILYYQGKLIKI